MTRAVITLTPNLREAPTNNLSYTKGTVESFPRNPQNFSTGSGSRRRHLRPAASNSWWWRTSSPWNWSARSNVRLSGGLFPPTPSSGPAADGASADTWSGRNRVQCLPSAAWWTPRAFPQLHKLATDHCDVDVASDARRCPAELDSRKDIEHVLGILSVNHIATPIKERVQQRQKQKLREPFEGDTTDWVYIFDSLFSVMDVLDGS